MNMNQRFVGVTGLLATALMWAMAAGAQPLPRAQTKPRTGRSFAQRLVEATQSKHPEADEVGISAVTSRGWVGIASTDKGDIGEKCEKDDSEPMRTGKPFVEKEKDGFDVSLPLHDASGKIVGSVGVGFKPAAGQTQAAVTQQAEKIAHEMEAQIPSKASLFETSQP